MTFVLKRRELFRGTAISLLPLNTSALIGESNTAQAFPRTLGIASYIFRDFDQSHLIEYMKQLQTLYLRVKDKLCIHARRASRNGLQGLMMDHMLISTLPNRALT